MVEAGIGGMMMDIVEVRRAGFEAWRLKKFCGGTDRLKKCSNAPGVYYYAAEQEAWSAWNAALDSVVVELPEPFQGDDFTMYDGKEIIEAIQSAGVQTK